MISLKGTTYLLALEEFVAGDLFGEGAGSL
jgi:hypothetical protein